MENKENAVVRFIKESISELKKVVWPTKKEVKTHTIVVIILSIAVAAFLGMLDAIFSLGLDKLIIRMR